MAKFVKIDKAYVNIDNIDALGPASVPHIDSEGDESTKEGTIIRLGMGTLTTEMTVEQVMKEITTTDLGIVDDY